MGKAVEWCDCGASSLLGRSTAGHKHVYRSDQRNAGRGRLQKAVQAGEQILTFTMVLYELRHGVGKSSRALANTERLAMFLSGPISVLPFKSRMRRRPARFERSSRPPESRLARRRIACGTGTRSTAHSGDSQCQRILAREGTELRALGEGLVTAVFRSNMYSLSRCQRPSPLRPELKCAGRNRTLLRRHPKSRFLAPLGMTNLRFDRLTVLCQLLRYQAPRTESRELGTDL